MHEQKSSSHHALEGPEIMTFDSTIWRINLCLKVRQCCMFGGDNTYDTFYRAMLCRARYCHGESSVDRCVFV